MYLEFISFSGKEAIDSKEDDNFSFAKIIIFSVISL